MMKRWVALGLALLVAGCGQGTNTGLESTESPSAVETSQSPSPSPSPSPPPPYCPPPIPAGCQRGSIAKHVDGDTVHVEIKEPAPPDTLFPLAPLAVHTIRLLEIDTPESTNRTDCFGPEASAFAKQQLPIGTTVYVLADKEDKDRYGRFLRYLWKADGLFYNDKAVREGFAKAVLYMPNDRFIVQMRQAESEAKAANRGLWKACAAPPPAPVPAPKPPAPVPHTPAPPPAPGNCDASYPTVCIAPAPPDLDCGDIPHRRFEVRPPDPHGFDGSDNDGLGCESG